MYFEKSTLMGHWRKQIAFALSLCLSAARSLFYFHSIRCTQTAALRKLSLQSTKNESGSGKFNSFLCYGIQLPISKNTRISSFFSLTKKELKVLISYGDLRQCSRYITISILERFKLTIKGRTKENKHDLETCQKPWFIWILTLWTSRRTKNWKRTIAIT